MKKLFLILTGSLICAALSAQNVTPQAKSFSADPFNHPQFPVFVASTLGAVVLILMVVVMIYAIQVVRLLKTGMAQAVAGEEIPATNPARRTAFQAYKWHLYGSGALLSAIIVIVISSKVVSTSGASPKTHLASTEVISQPEQPVVNENALEFTNDAATIERGSKVFQSNNCGSCHRADGGGNAIGPNLTDDFWLHGGDAKSIYSTIQNGVAEKAMPAWSTILTSDNVRDVTSYILSLQGTNPPDAKAPQGEKFTGTAAAE